MLPVRFEQCFGRFTMLFVEGSLEGYFLDIYVTSFFGGLLFKNTSAMRISFFFLKVQNSIWVSKMRKQNVEKVFCFWDICIRRCCNKLPLLSREYLSSAVNVLRNSPKILHITKKLFQTELLSQWSINLLKVRCC